MHIKSCFIFVILLFMHSPEHINAAEIFVIRHIHVSGLDRTNKKVILPELGFKDGDSIDLEDIKQGIKNLRNTNLFNNVNFSLSSSNGPKDLKITLEERWTTIPILKFASGGGVSQITLGVYDPNIFGEYLESGAQYQRLGDTNSGVAWLKKPRWFGSSFGVDLQLWNTSRLRTKYVIDADDPILKTGFLHKRSKLYLGLTKEYSKNLNFNFFYEYNDDSFSDDFITDEVKLLLNSTGLPPDSQVHFLGFSTDIGQINHKSYLIEGMLLKASYQYGVAATKGIADFWQSDVGFRYYKTVFGDATFAQRILAGFTTTEVLQYWYYLGGLDRIRGFADNRFAGRFFWLTNSEFRYVVYKDNWAVVQAVGFVDVAKTSESFRALGHIGALSTGVGARIILPKVYRFVVRFDYAAPIIRTDEINFSFGVQQFF